MSSADSRKRPSSTNAHTQGKKRSTKVATPYDTKEIEEIIEGVIKKVKENKLAENKITRKSSKDIYGESKLKLEPKSNNVLLSHLDNLRKAIDKKENDRNVEPKDLHMARIKYATGLQFMSLFAAYESEDQKKAVEEIIKDQEQKLSEETVYKLGHIELLVVSAQLELVENEVHQLFDHIQSIKDNLQTIKDKLSPCTLDNIDQHIATLKDLQPQIKKLHGKLYCPQELDGIEEVFRTALAKDILTPVGRTQRNSLRTGEGEAVTLEISSTAFNNIYDSMIKVEEARKYLKSPDIDGDEKMALLHEFLKAMIKYVTALVCAYPLADESDGSRDIILKTIKDQASELGTESKRRMGWRFIKKALKKKQAEPESELKPRSGGVLSRQEVIAKVLSSYDLVDKALNNAQTGESASASNGASDVVSPSSVKDGQQSSPGHDHKRNQPRSSKKRSHSRPREGSPSAGGNASDHETEVRGAATTSGKGKQVKK